jgi:imidazolonepropionase
VAATLGGMADPSVWEALARSTTIATLLPGESAGRALLDRGAAVALATGYGPESPSTLSLQHAMSLACAEMGLTPEEAITAATINAAHSLKLAERIGSLEPGKQADLVLLNCSDYHEIPYHFGVNHVHLTMKLGAVVYREGSAGTWPKPS